VSIHARGSFASEMLRMESLDCGDPALKMGSSPGEVIPSSFCTICRKSTAVTKS
jgi:hypothetical protein